MLFRAERLQPLGRMVRSFLDPTGWLRLPPELAGQVALYVLPLLVVDALQLLRRDEHVRRHAPLPLRGLLCATGLCAFILFGRFESNAFIYFQF